MTDDESQREYQMEVLTTKIAEALSRPDAPIDFEAHLGIEAKSILKSIETEATKLRQFDGLSRTDRHYFRARFNYYKLSILRLREKEREILEPRLIEFHQQITQREFETGGDPSDVQHTPFLEAVKPVKVEPVVEMPKIKVPDVPPPGFILNSNHHSAAPVAQPFDRDAVLSELAILKLALKAQPTIEGQKVISDCVDRIIARLK